MESYENVIIAILTFIFFIVMALIFKKPITNAKRVKISLTGIEFEASGDEFAQLFEKTYSNVLKKEHIEFFCNLFSFQHTPIVKEVLPDFDRASDDWKKSDKGKQTIGMLRALRGLGLIKPNGGGKWKSDTQIVITEFGKEFKNHIND